MKLICSLQVINRLAVAKGQNGAMKLVKAVVQLRQIPGGDIQILVSTNKDVSGQRYDVSKIHNLRTNFISKGMITIEMNQPPLDLMIRNANPDELTDFHKHLKEFMNSKRLPIVGSGQKKESLALEPVGNQAVETSSEVQRGVKRCGDQINNNNPKISKIEMSVIKKTLRKTFSRDLIVSDRRNYPREIELHFETVVMRNLLLKKIDSRLLTLNKLTLLNLSCNRITSIEPLRNCGSSLVKLVLSSNLIESISDDFFNFKAFENLMFLHLNENKLKCLPVSILQLKKLQTLDLSRNHLHVLPYNLHRLRSLLTLKVDGNLLDFIPITVCSLKLEQLDVSDNCFGNSVDGSEQTSFSLSPFPTLFELCAETISSHNFLHFKQGQMRIHSDAVPQLVINYMDACKCCFRCSRMSLRYAIVNSCVPNREGAQHVTNSPGFTTFATKKIICSRCAS